VLFPAHSMASITIKFCIQEGCGWPRWQRELGESMQHTISLASGKIRVRPKKKQDPDQMMPVQSLLNCQHNTHHRHHNRHPSNGGGIAQNENNEGLFNQFKLNFCQERDI
jgi:hypothetical protein